MIYQKITETINDALGYDFVLSYANNHDFKWEEVLPQEQDKIKYGCLRVDSGTTQQVGSQAVRIEQLRLLIAIPEARDIFNEAITNIRATMNALNGYEISEEATSTTAKIYFGEYHDASCHTVNGCQWWVAEVTFLANFYDSFVASSDVSISIGGADLNGILGASFINEKTFDGNVYNGSANTIGSINGIKKTLQVSVVYIKSDTLMTSLLDDEDSTSKTYTIIYSNSLKTRTITNMVLASISETYITGDILKAQLTFTLGA